MGGLRVGEAVALKRSKVDVKRGRVIIDASASEVAGRLTFGATKTKGSTRTITLPRFVVDQLAEHMRRHPTETGLVFSAPDGGPLRPNNWRRRVYGPALERAGLPHQSIHSLRHVCASTLAAAGGNAVEIAARLGHSNPAITQRVYTHLLATRDERLAELQQEAFTASKAKGPGVTEKLRRAGAKRKAEG
jgi:integrase